VKYIKTFEVKYLKKGQTTADTKFKEDDYVSLIDDFQNGSPSKDISKRVFKVKDIIGRSNKQHRNQYKLLYLNDKYFNWVWENDIKFAKKSDIKKEMKRIELENNMEKYNL